MVNEAGSNPIFIGTTSRHVSDSDDAENKESYSSDNYEQSQASSDHFITLDNFVSAPSSSSINSVSSTSNFSTLSEMIIKCMRQSIKVYAQPCNIESDLELTMSTEFVCEPVVQLFERDDYDDLINNNDDFETDAKWDDLYPIDNNPIVETIRAENGDFIQESAIGTDSDRSKLSHVIDENARAGVHDVANLHQVIDLNSNQILLISDDNATDTMDFENQIGKSFDMVNEEWTTQDRSDRNKIIIDGRDTDADPNTIVIGTTSSDVSDSHDAENEEYNLMLESYSSDNYEQSQGSSDHFITLDHFGSEETSKDATLTTFEGYLSYGYDGDDEKEMSSSNEDNASENNSETSVATMFCEQIFIEGHKSSYPLNDNSDSQSSDS